MRKGKGTVVHAMKTFGEEVQLHTFLMSALYANRNGGKYVAYLSEIYDDITFT